MQKRRPAKDSQKTQKKGRPPFVGRFLQKLAPRIGAKVILEPEWGYVGQIVYKNGTKRYFRSNSLDLNTIGASQIAKDKDYANFFMKKLGYPIVPGSKAFYSDEWAEKIGALDRTINFAYEYAEKIGLPVVVKPNSGSQGTHVSFAYSKSDFYKALKEIFKKDRIVLIQKPVFGKDYRIVVLDGRVISAYERIPFSVVGDGVSTIAELFENKVAYFKERKRSFHLKINDPRLVNKIKQQKLSLTSIPHKDQRVFLLDNANLSTGGDSIDVTNKIHPEFQKICVQLTHDMGLRLCGVDLMIKGDISERPKTYWVIEINSAPGLDHYVKSGKEQEKIVEELYLEVLKSLEK